MDLLTGAFILLAINITTIGLMFYLNNKDNEDN